MWSQNWPRTIRSGVVGIPKYLKNACKAGYFNIFGYAKNTTPEGPSSILRPLYNRYFCHITIEKWSQIGTRTIRNGFFKDILFLCLFRIVILIKNLISIKQFAKKLRKKIIIKMSNKLSELPNKIIHGYYNE